MSCAAGRKLQTGPAASPRESRVTETETEVGMPERIGKAIGDVLAALIIIAVIVMMIAQFA